MLLYNFIMTEAKKCEIKLDDPNGQFQPWISQRIESSSEQVIELANQHGITELVFAYSKELVRNGLGNEVTVIITQFIDKAHEAKADKGAARLFNEALEKILDFEFFPLNRNYYSPSSAVEREGAREKSAAGGERAL